MADNIGYTPGTGATVAADDIGGVLYQRVKINHGPDGEAIDVSEANPLPIQGDTSHGIADNTEVAPVKVGGVAKATAPAAVDDGDRAQDWSSLHGAKAVMITGADGTIAAVDSEAEALKVVAQGSVGIASIEAGDNNIGNVDVASSALPTGAATAANQSTVIAALATLAGYVDGIEALLAAATPAGNNNIGDVDVASLPALVAGSANIGDVDVLTVPADPFGANADAIVAAGAAGSIQAKLRRLTQGVEDLKTTIILAAGSAAIGKLAANSGVDIGDVDVTSVPADPFGANADAVVAAGAVGSIQAKLRRLTTDMDAIKTSVAAATPAGTNNIGDVDVLTIAAGDNNIGNVDIVTVPADPFGATADAVVAAGATGSISAKLRRVTQGLEDLKTLIVLGAGSAAIGKLAANSGVDIGDVDVTSLPASTNTLEVVGDIAEDSALSGNPVRQGWRASTAVPTAMSADGDVVTPWANRNGAPVVAVAPHVGLNADPFTLTTKTTQYTSAQTGVAFVTPTGGKKLVVTKVQIQIGGTVAGTWILWFGGSADTTYTRGTDRAIFDGEFAPSATNKPGVVMDGPWIAGAADDILRVTGVGAINPQTVTVWYYEI